MLTELEERIDNIEKQLHALTDIYKYLTIQVGSLMDHKVRQIDENRKSYNKLLELKEQMERNDDIKRR